LGKKELLSQIMGLAYLLNENSKWDVFVDFSGHVNGLTIQIIDPEGDGDSKRLAEDHIYLDYPDAEDRLAAVKDRLVEILSTGEIDQSKCYRASHGHREAFYLSKPERWMLL